MKALLFLLLAASSLLAQPAAKPKAEPVTIITAGVLIDGVAAEPKRDVTIVIRGNRIESVGARPAIISDGADKPRLLDLSGYTVLPGLIDSHTHLFLQGEVPEEGGYDAQLLKFPAAYRAARATVSARRALEQGFTTIRDVETEGAGYGDVGIRMAVDEGRIPGPRSEERRVGKECRL